MLSRDAILSRAAAAVAVISKPPTPPSLRVGGGRISRREPTTACRLGRRQRVRRRAIHRRTPAPRHAYCAGDTMEKVIYCAISQTAKSYLYRRAIAPTKTPSATRRRTRSRNGVKKLGAMLVAFDGDSPASSRRQQSKIAQHARSSNYS